MSWNQVKTKREGEHLACSFCHEGEHYRCKLWWAPTSFENPTGDYIPYLEIWHAPLSTMTSFGTYPRERRVAGNVGGMAAVRRRRTKKTLIAIAAKASEEKIVSLCK